MNTDNTEQQLIMAVNNLAAMPVKRIVTAYRDGYETKEFESSAVTWGQLKQEILEKGFPSFENTSVCEGITMIDFSSDEAILPTNINFRGKTTNNLTIVMTAKDKDIKSGSMINADTATHKELRNFVKDLFGSIYTYNCSRAFFGNYTHLKTDELRRKVRLWILDDNNNVCSPVKRKPVSLKTKAGSKPGKDENLSKLREAQQACESKDYVVSEVSNEQNKYEEAQAQIDNGLLHISYGVMLIQNAKVFTDKPFLSANELKDIVNKVKMSKKKTKD